MSKLLAIFGSNGGALVGAGAVSVALIGAGAYVYNKQTGPETGIETAQPAAAVIPQQASDPAPEQTAGNTVSEETVTEAAQEASAGLAPPAQAPRFDEVRRETDGLTVVAGQAAPGSDVRVLLDGKEVGAVTADASGSFAAIAFLDVSDVAQVLTLEQQNGEAVTASLDEIILAPTPRAEPEVAEAVTEPEAAEATPEPEVATQEPLVQPSESVAGQEVLEDTETAIAEAAEAAPEQPDTEVAALEPETASAAEPLIADAPEPDQVVQEAPTSEADAREVITSETASAQPDEDEVLEETATAAVEATQTAPLVAEPVETSEPEVASVIETPSPSAGSDTQPAAQPIAEAPDVAVSASEEQQAAAVDSDAAPAKPEATETEIDLPKPEVTDRVVAALDSETPTGESVPLPRTDRMATSVASPEIAKPVEAPSVTLIRSTSEGVEVLRPALAPDAMTAVELDTISYSAGGEVQLSGRAQAVAEEVRVYLDNAPVATLDVDRDGRWRGDLPNITTGIYTLRVDEVADDGTVTSRVETPFKRESKEALAQASAGQDGPAKVITVQKGATLWAIARERYGDPTLYVRVFAANSERIRDPDLIYPGQVFDLPD